VKTALLIPGQGHAIARDALLWSRESPRVRSLVEIAAARAGVSAESLPRVETSRGLPPEILSPFHTALCLGIHLELAQRGFRPDFVAGHSLGEVSACAVAGACSATAAIELAAVRGRLMAREAKAKPGGMVAIHAPDEAGAVEALAFAKEGGIAALAAYNAPGEWVISGEWSALRRLAARRPGILLPVHGAWHCELLAGAVEEYRAAALSAMQGTISIPLVCNQSGSIVRSSRDLPDRLAAQFTQPVQWNRCVSTMARGGVTEWAAVGPGRALLLLNRRIPEARGAARAACLPSDLRAFEPNPA